MIKEEFTGYSRNQKPTKNKVTLFIYPECGCEITIKTTDKELIDRLYNKNLKVTFEVVK